jgi:hypothetical protein
MERYTEEAHQRQSPYVLEIVQAESEAPASASVQTLRAWRDQLNADDGLLADPIGKRHPVELAAWARDDPDHTKLAIRFVLPPDFDRNFCAGDDVVPGTVYVEVREFDPTDSRFIHADSTGTERPIGATLRALRIALGGDDGVVTDPDGNTHAVSLGEWAHCDPDATWLYVSFSHQQRSAPYRFHGSRGDTRWHHAAMDRVLSTGEDH